MSSATTEQRWMRVYLAAQKVLESPTQSRRQAAEEVCAGDAELLTSVWDLVRRSAEESEFLEFSPVTRAVEADESESGTRIGLYEVEREIGRGGMGRVLLAHRVSQFSKQVAIKVVNRFAGADLKQRFLRERQILAHLEHPGIARLLDGGETASGSPYLVMEYVDGRPIQEYCKQNDLSTEARLRLFLQVCEAVEYAHWSLIVHRDLKPSNILVTTGGQVKLLDFGIAKLVEHADAGADLTVTGIQMLTPAYASPEQLGGQAVTAATDIYSLGVVLYELLTGQMPFPVKGLPLLDALRVLAEREARPAGSVAPQLKGDVEAILLRCLEREPADRYRSVQDLRRDVERFLRGRPVEARPRTWFYLATKYVRRNRRVLSVAAVMVVIIGIAVGSWWREARRADRKAAEVRAVTSRIAFGYFDRLAGLPGSVKLRKQLAEDASAILDQAYSEAPDSPELAADVANAWRRVGEVQAAGPEHVGDFAGGIHSYRRAIAIREMLIRRTPGDPALRYELAFDLTRLSFILLPMRDPDFDGVAARVIQILEGLPPAWQRQARVQTLLTNTLDNIAYRSTVRGDLEGAVRNGRRLVTAADAWERMDADGARSQLAVPTARERLAGYLVDVGQWREAAKVAREAVEFLRADEAAGRPETEARVHFRRWMLARALMAEARAVHAGGETGRALPMMREALRIQESLYLGDPADSHAASDLLELLFFHNEMLDSVGMREEAGVMARRGLSLALDYFRAVPVGQDAHARWTDLWIELVGRLLDNAIPADRRVIEQAYGEFSSRSRTLPHWKRWFDGTARALTRTSRPNKNPARQP